MNHTKTGLSLSEEHAVQEQVNDLVFRLKKIGADLEDLTSKIDSTIETSASEPTALVSQSRHKELLLMHLRTRVKSMISGVSQAVHLTEAMDPAPGSQAILN